MADSALQRKNMVESQIRPSDITDRRITAAMSDIAREAFLPSGLDKTLAYMDGAISAGAGRTLLAPRTLARLLQLAAVQAQDKVLIAGAATGYSAAILSRMAKAVVALESDVSLAKSARETIKALGLGNVEVAEGPLPAGHAPGAPYDVILVEGALEAVPEALISQLAQGGRLVAIEAGNGIGHAVVTTKTALAVSSRVAFEAGASLLPGFAQPKGFVF